MSKQIDKYKRLLTHKEKEDYGLFKTHLYFWEQDLYLVAKSTLNIAYTISKYPLEKESLNHVKALNSLKEFFKTQLSTIKINEDYYCYEDFYLKLDRFINIAEKNLLKNPHRIVVDYYNILHTSFQKLPVVDFQDDTITSFLTENSQLLK